MRLSPRQKEVLLGWFHEATKERPVSPVGADVDVTHNLEKKGLLVSVQTYPQGHPYSVASGPLSAFGYEVRHFYPSELGRAVIAKYADEIKNY
jgi:hypothetical protein